MRAGTMSSPTKGHPGSAYLQMSHIRKRALSIRQRAPFIRKKSPISFEKTDVSSRMSLGWRRNVWDFSKDMGLFLSF